MKNIKKLSILLSVLLINSLFADVIYFSNGDIDEGYARNSGDRFIISTKDMTGSYGVQTNRVMCIKYGKWIENLDEATQKVAKNTKQIKSITVIETEEPMGGIEGELPKQVLKSINVSKLKNGKLMFWIMGVSFVIFTILSLICSIFLLIDAFKCSLAWGLCSLLIPFVAWVYLFKNYSGNKGKIFLGIISPLLWIIISFSITLLTK